MAKEQVDNLRAWFDEHGWQLAPAELRAALEERGATADVIVDLLDEGADRRRAQPQPKPEPVRPRRGELAHPPATNLVPPQNLEAEESVLGAAMLSNGSSIPRCAEIVQPEHFYRESHAKIWAAAITLHGRGVPVDPITLTDELERTRDLESVGGRVRLHELAALVPASANAPHYARIVFDCAVQRSRIRLGGEIARVGWEGGTLDGLVDQVRLLELAGDVGAPPEALGGGAFVFDEPVDDDAIRIWGEDSAIGWAAGEALMLVGPDGVGKTTLGQQLALARAGLRQQVLGMNVAPDGRRVLYIAADRPRQAARSIRRMVAETERDQLDEALTFWRGPLPGPLNEDRGILTRLAKQFDAGTIVIDSLKDVAFDLSADEAAGRIATCFQHAIASGIELLVLHHPRKPGVEQARKPREISDVYGNRLIFGVFGSIIMLWGDPGDAYIELSHIKQPIEPIGPWNVHHDHARGASTIEKGTDLIDIVLRAGTTGVTAKDAAALVYEKEAPTKNDVEKIRNRLKRLAQADRIVEMPSTRGSDGNRFFFNGPAEALR